MAKTLAQMREGLSGVNSGPPKKKHGKADAPWHKTMQAVTAIAYNWATYSTEEE